MVLPPTTLAFFSTVLRVVARPQLQVVRSMLETGNGMGAAFMRFVELQKP